MATPQSEVEDVVWKVQEADKVGEGTPATVVIYDERKGNKFHLSAIIRKYTAAKVEFIRDKNSMRCPVVKIEASKLWDALGLLRSLQYDVAEFNAVTRNKQGNNDMDPMEAKYRCFRLSRQAASFGVRLPRVGEDIIEVDGLDSLVEFIEKEHKDSIEAARANIESGVVDFDSLQEFFIPGKMFIDHGVGTGMSVDTMMRARACYYTRRKSLFGETSTFHVAMEVIVSTGDSKYAVVEVQFMQSPFNGTRSTQNSYDMFTVPSETLIEELKERGQQYQRICSAADAATTSGSGVMVEYDAGTFLPTSKGSLKGGSSRAGSYGQASRSGGRMMVDTMAAWSRGVHCATHDGVAADAVVASLKMYAQKRAQQRASQGSDSYSTGTPGGASDADNHNELLVLSSPLPESLLGMTWPAVVGFSNSARTWGLAMVHGTRAVEFNEKAFDSLVLSESRKKLLKAIVTSHEVKRKQADLIAGKGEGSIFLLHGPPGVGKTLTAEAIAEVLHKPLYVVSMGELGTSPETVEERLQDILDLCVPWKALVLIDEAEMLLERRTKNDIVRNAMVCVMLRLLEYYSGILFLTTNRVESLDPAVQSRVTCALRYDPLTTSSRKEIWITLMTRLGMDLSTIDVDKLAQVEINGRQIKNTLQLAFALAQHDNVPVSQEHLETTLDVTTSFLKDTGSSEVW